MKVYTPSPCLRRNTLFFGLNSMDLVGLSMVLMISQKIGLESVFKGVPVLLTVLAALILIPVRMRYPRGTIRAFIKYWGRNVAIKFIKNF